MGDFDHLPRPETPFSVKPQTGLGWIVHRWRFCREFGGYTDRYAVAATHDLANKQIDLWRRAS